MIRIVALLLSIGAYAETREFEVSDFTGIHLMGDASLEIVQAGDESLVAMGDGLQVVDVDIVDGVLVIDTTDHRCGNLRFVARVDTLDLVKISGDVEVSIDVLTADELRLEGRGDAQFFIADLSANELHVENRGDTNVEIAGVMRRQVLDLAGDARYEGLDLVSQQCEIRISGDGRVSIHATETLDVRVSGGGRIDYRGSPVIAQRVSGSGRIQQVD